MYANQVFKLHGTKAMAYRGLGQAALLLPFMFWFEPIHNWQFYALCLFQGGLIGFDDNRLFRSAKAFGAEVTSAVQPLSLGLIFILWLVLNPGQFGELLSEPAKFILSVLCLAGVTFSILGLLQAKASRRALRYLLPVLFAMSLNDVINKECMSLGAERLSSAVYYYILITSAVYGAANLFAYLKRYDFSELLNISHMKKGAVIIILTTVVMILKNLAMSLTPNPAYASAIIFLYPLWIILGNNLYYRLKACKTYPRINFKVIAVLLTSVIGLILLH